MITIQSIPEQLVEIYNTQEWWHKTRMSYEETLQYHTSRYKNGDIHTYQENGEVLGYYERYLLWDTCILYNVWIKEDYRQGNVFKELYRYFFATMPKNIKYIIGEKVKLSGKKQKVSISKERLNV